MKTCLSLAEPSPALLAEKLVRYADRCDLIEVRLDFQETPTVPILPSKRAEFIATCRPTREGGRFRGSERERLNLLWKCAASGFRWVDLERDADLPRALPPTSRLIRSHHEFDGTTDWAAALSELKRRGGDLYKLAITVKDSDQLVALLDWMESLGPEIRRVVVGMGARGRLSRYLGELLGNQWTYVSEPDNPVAPGQFSLEEAGRLPSAAPEKIFGVMGRPISHSLSPHLHNWLFRRHGLNRWYLPVELDRLSGWFEYLDRSRLPFAGFSVTLPFKTEVLGYLESFDSPVDSVNTLNRVPPGWVGRNTDIHGFLQPLRRRLRLKGAAAIVLGTGGVANTVVHALLGAGATVTVWGRSRRKTAAFGGRHGCSWDLISNRPAHADVLVNATPVGQAPSSGESLLRKEQLKTGLVYDLVYNPPRTKLLRLAEEAGCRTISGLEMFVEQAALQFELWNGIRPDREAMTDYLKELL